MVRAYVYYIRRTPTVSFPARNVNVAWRCLLLGLDIPNGRLTKAFKTLLLLLGHRVTFWRECFPFCLLTSHDVLLEFVIIQI